MKEEDENEQSPEDLLEDDEISVGEEGFMQGYDEDDENEYNPEEE